MCDVTPALLDSPLGDAANLITHAPGNAMIDDELEPLDGEHSFCWGSTGLASLDLVDGGRKVTVLKVGHAVLLCSIVDQ
jgi:hypothetical protein